MSRVVPEGRDAPGVHVDEVRSRPGERAALRLTAGAQGYDDMPAHVKAAMFGSSLTLPIKAGRFALGTWQVRAATTRARVMPGADRAALLRGYGWQSTATRRHHAASSSQFRAWARPEAQASAAPRPAGTAPAAAT